MEGAIASLAHRGAPSLLETGLESARLYIFRLQPESPSFATLSKDQPMVVLDGRLENPAEVLACLGGDQSITDHAGIVRRAWVRWSDNTFERLKGRFAVVISDPAARRVVAFRSAVAGKALYYSLDQKRLILASEESALLSFDIDHAIDIAWISHYFYLSTPPSNRTAFAAVRELLPGEVLNCTLTGTTIKRMPPVFGSEDEAVYKADDACADRFLELLTHAVAASTACPGRFGIMQSSGVDSSAIAAVAATTPEIRKQLGATYSWSLKQFPDADESPQISQLTSQLGLKNAMFAGDACWPPKTVEEWPLSPNTPVSNPFRVLKARLYAHASRDGCSMLLNGNAGDLLYPHPGYLMREAWDGGQYGVAMEEFAKRVRRAGVGGLPGIIRRRFFRPLLQRSSSPTIAPSHLTDFSLRHLDTATRWPPEVIGQPRSDHYEGLLGLDFARSVEAESYFINGHGLEWEEPYLNHDLVGFMLQIPAWQCYRHGQDKYVARQAMRGLLPESVRIQSRVGLLGEIFRKGFYQSRPWIVEILQKSGAEWPRYVRREYIDSALDKATMSDSEMMHVWYCVSFEMWLDRYFG